MVKLENSGSFHMFLWSKTFRQFTALVSQDDALYIITWPVVFWLSFKPMWAGVCAQRRELLLPSQTRCGGWHTMLCGPQRRLCGGSLQSTCTLTTAQNHTHKQFILTPYLCWKAVSHGEIVGFEDPSLPVTSRHGTGAAAHLDTYR